MVTVGEVDVVYRVLGRSILTLLLVTVVGCVAIWPVTVPKRSSHKGVAVLCPPVGISPNLGKKALEDVDVGTQFASVALMHYMMT